MKTATIHNALRETATRWQSASASAAVSMRHVSLLNDTCPASEQKPMNYELGFIGMT